MIRSKIDVLEEELRAAHDRYGRMQTFQAFVDSMRRHPKARFYNVAVAYHAEVLDMQRNWK